MHLRVYEDNNFWTITIRHKFKNVVCLCAGDGSEIEPASNLSIFQEKKYTIDSSMAD